MNANGYRTIWIDGKARKSHRLAFLYMNGAWPAHDVDHINRDRSDNTWGNLREASRTENCGNQKDRVNNTSGYRGVAWDRKSQKWKAYGSREGRRAHLGFFENLEKAAETARNFHRDTFGPFASA